MEEVEIPLESVNEQVEHAHGHQQGHGGGGHQQHVNWITWAALISAVLAVLAAVSALYAGSRVNEAMMKQMKSSDQWAYYQAKGIKAAVLETRLSLLEKLPHGAEGEIAEKTKAKLEKYAEEQKEISEKAEHFEKESEENFEHHEVFAHAVTLFQIAIAVTAIAVLAKRRRFLVVSLAFGILGTGFLVKGLFL